MTERGDALERIARLQERRSRSTDSAAPVEPEPDVAREPLQRSTAAALARRRHRPGEAAKVVTVGASVTAVLGMIALYGAAERAASATTQDLPSPEVAVSGAAAAVSTLGVTPPGTSPAVDPELGGAASTSPAIPATTTPTTLQTTGTTVPLPAPTTGLVPVPAPTAVDLAVPAPPVAAAPAAAAPAPAAPAPVAETRGS